MLAGVVISGEIQFTLDGHQVEVPDDGGSLLGALRDHLGVREAKDGCSPQGQCGCCTVLVDNAPRVACVTPARRVRGRVVMTAAGLTDDERRRWANAFLANGASQCGFCTPGIVCRLVGHERRGADLTDRETVDKALAAHLCRCTGWQTIREAAAAAVAGAAVEIRSLDGAARRAALESDGPQSVSAGVVLGDSAFSDDTAPDDALVAVHGPEGWAVGETLHEARLAAGKIQGRRTTLDPVPPIDLAPGDWVTTLRTSWTEPGYLETDAAWCRPGGEPSDPLANGGAFGAKRTSEVGRVARQLADEHGRAVRVLWSREDSVRWGPKRPPIAAGVDSEGGGIVRVAAAPGVETVLRDRLPACRVETVALAGPPVSLDLRGAVWTEAEMLKAAIDGAAGWITAPGGGRAQAELGPEGIHVRVDAGEPLDEVMVRSYAIGAAHMAWSWLNSEAIVVDEEGAVHDLTIRSFGILRSSDMPSVRVDVGGSGDAAKVGDAVFAAVAAAGWLHLGCPPELPHQTPS